MSNVTVWIAVYITGVIFTGGIIGYLMYGDYTDQHTEPEQYMTFTDWVMGTILTAICWPLVVLFFIIQRLFIWWD